MAKVREKPLAKGIKQIVWILILLGLIFSFFRFGGAVYIQEKMQSFIEYSGLDKEAEIEVNKGSDYKVEGEK